MLCRQLQDMHTRIIRPLIIVSRFEKCARRRKVRLERLHIAIHTRLEHITLIPDIVRKCGAERYLSQRLWVLTATIISTPGTRSYTHDDGAIGAVVIQLRERFIGAAADLKDLADAHVAASDAYEFDV